MYGKLLMGNRPAFAIFEASKRFVQAQGVFPNFEPTKEILI